MSEAPAGRGVSLLELRRAPARWLAADRRAVTSLEYALIGAFVFLAIVGALRALGVTLAAPFVAINAALAG